MRPYRIHRVTGDRFAGEFPREAFRRRDIHYEVAASTKSEYYSDAIALLNSRRVELLDHPRLLSQIAGLERRVGRAGRDAIDHAPAAHDDLANVACALACELTVTAKPTGGVVSMDGAGAVGAPEVYSDGVRVTEDDVIACLESEDDLIAAYRAGTLSKKDAYAMTATWLHNYRAMARASSRATAWRWR